MVDLYFPFVKTFILLLGGCYTRMWGVLLEGLSDCEELVGVTHKGMMGLVFLSYSRNPTPFRLSAVGEVTLSQVVPLSVDLKMFPELPTATNVLFPKVTA